MFCENCGKELSGNFCSSCGNSVKEISTISNEQQQETTEFNFSAQKIGARAIKLYTTTVKITGKNISVSSTAKAQDLSEAKLNDIVSVTTGLTPIINKIDIFRFILAFGLMFVPTPPVLYGLFAFAFVYYYTLIKTLKIKFKNGKVFKVYYERKEDLRELENLLSTYIAM